ncbi:hypothetical protein [Microcoleus sp. S13_B4]|uniref:hypothetical protein n=1 Tax=Microcoleus sp. S13_B4 TaxID=3055408 RepID=UPI002FCEA259
MSITSSTTLSQIVSKIQSKVPDKSNLFGKASDQILLETIGKLINLDEIVDRIQAMDHHQCSLFMPEQVKFAFLKWIENHLESIELQPEWYLTKDFKHFDRHLPFEELQAAVEQEFDVEAVYQEIGDAHEAGLFDNSSLEDQFTGTAQQAAADALTW